MKITKEEYMLWLILHQNHDLITRCEEDLYSKTNITAQQFLVLWGIKYISGVGSRPVIISDLAPMLNRSVKSVASIVSRMENNGLLKKQRNLPDQRAIRLTITPKGNVLFTNAARPHLGVIKKVFQDFSKEELQTAIAINKKLKKRLTGELHLPESRIDRELNNPLRAAKFINESTFQNSTD